MTLELDVRMYEACVAHAREGAPAEVCGILAGSRGATAPAEEGTGTGETPERGRDRVTRVLRATNVADSPRTRYELDPAEQLDLMREVEDAGDEVVGFYHSHPGGPAEPSPTDERLATWEGYLYLVVSLAGDEPAVGAWRWTGEAFVPTPVERTDADGSSSGGVG